MMSNRARLWAGGHVTRYLLFLDSAPQHFARIPWAPMTPQGTAKEPAHAAVVAKNPGHSVRVLFFNYRRFFLYLTLTHWRREAPPGNFAGNNK